MGCDSCDRAAREVSYEFMANCRGCCARAAARSPQFDTARRVGRIDRPYRALLDQFGLKHDEVKAAAATDMLGKEPA